MFAQRRVINWNYAKHTMRQKKKV